MRGNRPEDGRRSPRHLINDQLALEIAVRRRGETRALEADAQLIDVSRQGLKLSLSESLAFHETVDVDVRCIEPAVEFSVSAEVKWLRRDDDTETWIIGCSVSNQIPDEFFERIATCGAYNRRSAPRHETTKEAVVRWEASQRRIPVGIVNLSPGGFCISSPEPGHEGKGLMLEFEDSDGNSMEVTAKSMWQLEFESGYLIGCESSVDLARKLIHGPTKAFQYQVLRRSLSLPSLIGIVLIAFIFCAFALIR